MRVFLPARLLRILDRLAQGGSLRSLIASATDTIQWDQVTGCPMMTDWKNGAASPRRVAWPRVANPHGLVLACLLLGACQPVEPAAVPLETPSEPATPLVSRPARHVPRGASRGPAESAGEDWPSFLGPRSDGTSREAGLLESWPRGGTAGFVVAPSGGVLQRSRDRTGTPDPVSPPGK